MMQAVMNSHQARLTSSGKSPSRSTDNPANGATAVQWQNIDPQVTRNDLVGFLELLGFGNSYIDVDMVSEGIAVVTFHSMRDVGTFHSTVHGKVGKVFGSTERPARVQIENAGWLFDSLRQHNPQEASQEAQRLEQTARAAELRALGRTGGTHPTETGVPGKVHNKIPTPQARKPDEKASTAAVGGEKAARAGSQPSTDSAEWPAGVTTAMIRNIACRFTRESVTRQLDRMGFRGKYDACRVPRRAMQSKCGYAFVNFVTPQAAYLCHRRCHGRTFGDLDPNKLCEVLPAKIQGVVTPTDIKQEANDEQKSLSSKKPPAVPNTVFLAAAEQCAERNSLSFVQPCSQQPCAQQPCAQLPAPPMHASMLWISV